MCLASYVLFLIEPVVRVMVNPLSSCARYSKRAKYFADNIDSRRNVALGYAKNHTDGRAMSSLQIRLWQTWTVASLILLLIFCVVIFVGGIALIIVSVAELDLEKYVQSERLGWISDQLVSFASDPVGSSGEELKADVEEASSTVFDRVIAGPLMNLAFAMLSGLTTLAFSLLLLIFLLFLQVWRPPGKRHGLVGTKVRGMVKTYIRIKNAHALCVSILTFIVLQCFRVDLAVIIAILTFFLNHLPHIGYVISSLLPMPLLILDPAKTLTEIVFCGFLLLSIHHLFSSILEPNLLARSSLQISPILYLVSFLFWMFCWGIFGAFLAAPLTCGLRLILDEINHPYALFLRQWLYKRRS